MTARATSLVWLGLLAAPWVLACDDDVDLELGAGSDAHDGPADVRDAGAHDTGDVTRDASVPVVDGGQVVDAGHMDVASPDGDDRSADASDVPVLEDRCGPHKVLCRATTCPPDLCLAPSHIPENFGTWARAPELADKTLDVFYRGGFLDTATGRAGAVTGLGFLPGWRGPNRDPRVYEVLNGIGFVRLGQGPAEPEIAVWVFKSVRFLSTSGGAVSPTISMEGDAPALLASAGDLFLDKSVRAFVAHATEHAAGGNEAGPARGCAPGASTANAGGGGGFGTDGSMIPGGGAGGSGGGAGSAPPDPLASDGGWGGGAIQFTALGTLTLNAPVVADGGTGFNAVSVGGPSGGGSGGAIFIESPSIRLGTDVALSAAGGGTKSFNFGGPPIAHGGVPGGHGRVVIRTLPGQVPPHPVPDAGVTPAPGSPGFRVLTNLGQ